MLGFKCFRHAAIIISGIEFVHQIRKGQFDLSALCPPGQEFHRSGRQCWLPKSQLATAVPLPAPFVTPSSLRGGLLAGRTRKHGCGVYHTGSFRKLQKRSKNSRKAAAILFSHGTVAPLLFTCGERSEVVSQPCRPEFRVVRTGKQCASETTVKTHENINQK